MSQQNEHECFFSAEPLNSVLVSLFKEKLSFLESILLLLVFKCIILISGLISLLPFHLGTALLRRAVPRKEMIQRAKLYGFYLQFWLYLIQR